jgi:hypothetical protein
MQFLYLDFSHFYLACGFYTLISDIFSLACGLLFMCNGLSVELVYFFYPVIPTRVVGGHPQSVLLSAPFQWQHESLLRRRTHAAVARQAAYYVLARRRAARPHTDHRAPAGPPARMDPLGMSCVTPTRPAAYRSRRRVTQLTGHCYLGVWLRTIFRGVCS